MKKNPAALLSIAWPDLPAGVRVLSTRRGGGGSVAPFDDGAGGGFNLGLHVGDDPLHVAANRRQLRSLLPAEPSWLTQVHGISVVDAAVVPNGAVADASVADQAGVVCAILSADCLPVLFCDAGGAVVGAAHAGWRGLAGGVLQATVTAMRATGAGDILAWLGPAIGPRHFEVGAEVCQCFVERDPDAMIAFMPIAERPGKYRADLYRLARMALAQVGIDRVAGGDQCTYTQRDDFFSFRRDGQTGRMASLIWID